MEKVVRDRDSSQREVDLPGSSTNLGKSILVRCERRCKKIDKMMSEMNEKLTRDKLEFEERLMKTGEELRAKNAAEVVYKTRLDALELRVMNVETTLANSDTHRDDYQDSKSPLKAAAAAGSYHASPHSRCSLKIIDVIKNNLDKQNLKEFEKSCFGPLLKINQLRFQGQLMLHLLLHLDTAASNKEKLLFKINNSNTEFGPKDFSLITGLSFDASEAATTSEATASSTIHEDVFNGRSSITLKDVEEAFLRLGRVCEGRGELTLNLALLYFLYGVLLVNSGKLDMHYLHLVDDLHKFKAFPWGRVAYELLASSALLVRARLDASKITHRRSAIDMYGFSFALQAWIYEVMPSVATHCAFRAHNLAANMSPLILRWFATKIFRFDDLKKFFTPGPGGNASLVLSSIQDSPLQKNTKVQGGVPSTDTMRTHINQENCDRLESLQRKFDKTFLDISSDGEQAVKNAEQPASASTAPRHATFDPNLELEIDNPALDKPWKACIYSEMSESEYERSRDIYERLLNRSKDVKVWVYYAKFEAFTMREEIQESNNLPDKRICLHRARAVFERALSYFRTSAPDLKVERAMLLEEWLDMENSFGKLGDVDLVRAKLPHVLKKRRRVEAEDGPARYEEYFEYCFPDETRAKDVQILEAAYKWKNNTNKEFKVYDRRTRSQQHISLADQIAAEDDRLGYTGW